jgi:hypothetical protein
MSSVIDEEVYMALQGTVLVERVPLSADSVRSHTLEEINDLIDLASQESVYYYAKQSRGTIHTRIDELDHEWDIERVIGLTGASLSLTGLLLSITGSSKWVIVPLIAMSFLLEHAIQGWCPPVAVLRRLGVRTRREIDSEKYALLALQRATL